MNNDIPYLDEWLELARSGNFEKAQEIYYEKLFISVIDKFALRYADMFPNRGVLFSVLGFSPEPIILTASAMNPDIHIVFTSGNKLENIVYLEKYLSNDFEVVSLQDESFNSIYMALKERFFLNPSSQIAIDITGGKKSMVAAAAIFGKDYNCKILYVDFKDYIRDLRKPLPGSEVLNVVYDPLIHQPEIFLK